MNEEVVRIIKRLSGQPCARKEVGRMKSLSLGFGSEAQRTTRQNARAYRTWELGTYRSAWRVVREGIVLCGSQDTADINELNLDLQRIELGRFTSLWQPTALDVRVELDNGVAVDFFPAASDGDECFHIFCPDELLVEFSERGGWKIGPSDQSWDIQR